MGQGPYTGSTCLSFPNCQSTPWKRIDAPSLCSSLGLSMGPELSCCLKLPSGWEHLAQSVPTRFFHRELLNQLHTDSNAAPLPYHDNCKAFLGVCLPVLAQTHLPWPGSLPLSAKQNLTVLLKPPNQHTGYTSQIAEGGQADGPERARPCSPEAGGWTPQAEGKSSCSILG